MTPTTALTQALDEVQAHAEFARLPSQLRLLLAAAVLVFGREQLLTGNGAADQAGRVIAGVTGSDRLGDAAARAVRTWAGGLH